MRDTGECIELPLDEAMVKFCTEDFWKVSFDLPSGVQMRLVKEDDEEGILPTFAHYTISAGQFQLGFPTRK